MERRITSTEVRASGAGKEMRVSGYAARYNSLSNKLGDANNSFRERIAGGAFERILRTKPDVVFLRNHEANNILGRTSSGTLTLRSDDKGLWFDCLLPNTEAGRDTHELVKRGDLKNCSFAFNLGERMDDWEEEEIEDEKDLGLRYKAKRAAKCIVRTIRDFASLLDCSVVTYPAYSQTSVDARSLIPAEVRSRLEAFRNPASLATKHHSFNKRNREAAIQCATEKEAQTIVARRKDLTNFLLS